MQFLIACFALVVHVNGMKISVNVQTSGPFLMLGKEKPKIGEPTPYQVYDYWNWEDAEAPSGSSGSATSSSSDQHTAGLTDSQVAETQEATPTGQGSSTGTLNKNEGGGTAVQADVNKDVSPANTDSPASMGPPANLNSPPISDLAHQPPTSPALVLPPAVTPATMGSPANFIPPPISDLVGQPPTSPALALPPVVTPAVVQAPPAATPQLRRRPTFTSDIISDSSPVTSRDRSRSPMMRRLGADPSPSPTEVVLHEFREHREHQARMCNPAANFNSSALTATELNGSSQSSMLDVQPIGSPLKDKERTRLPSSSMRLTLERLNEHNKQFELAGPKKEI